LLIVGAQCRRALRRVSSGVWGFLSFLNGLICLSHDEMVIFVCFLFILFVVINFPNRLFHWAIVDLAVLFDCRSEHARDCRARDINSASCLQGCREWTRFRD
jgi:hypothetical protein